ncbi:MAG: flagellar biosynthetic protein FliO [Acidobacteriota bacterium]|jgi:flagellar biosynthetic protein FliO|nr:flagellar biosynthetic protein FliO [Acidobacteriota bacterium]
MRGILPIFLALALGLGAAFPQGAEDAARVAGDAEAVAHPSAEGSTASVDSADAGGEGAKKNPSSKKAAKAAKKPETKAERQVEPKKAAKPVAVAADVTAAGGVGDESSASDGEDGAAPTVSAASEDGEGYPFQEGPPQISMLRTLGGLGLVLCLLGAAYFGVRKFAPGMFPFPKVAGGNNLKLIETLSLGDKRSLSLVEVGGSRFLLGSTPGQVNLLANLPGQVSLVESMVGEGAPVVAAEEGAEGKGFRNIFEIEKKRPAPPPSSMQYTGNMPPEDIRLKMRRLREALEQ